jgi:hypothetical protein
LKTCRAPYLGLDLPVSILVKLFETYLVTQSLESVVDSYPILNFFFNILTLLMFNSKPLYFCITYMYVPGTVAFSFLKTFFCLDFGRLESAGHSLAYVAH